MLRSVHPERLVRYLQRFEPFFSNRGINLPTIVEGGSEQALRERIDYDGLTRVFASPDAPLPAAPKELIDSACLIDELATPEGMDSILAGAEKAKLKLDKHEDQAPIDVVIQAWLLNPEFTATKHAEQYLDRPRSFEYFPRLANAPGKIQEWTETRREAVEKDLDDWFDKRRRGRGSHVFVFPREGSTWYLIRHGMPLCREGSMDNGNPSSVTYRPMRFDVVVHDHELDELRMNAQSKGEKTLYREVLGKHLYGNSAYFGMAAKYTLDPVRVAKRECLVCEDISGIEWIKLQEVQFFWGGVENEIETRKASDLYAAYEAKKIDMPSRPKIIKAKFEVKFEDSRTTRKVTVRANTTQCVRDADTVLIEAWLEARGFATSGTGTLSDTRKVAPEILVDAGVVAGFTSKLRGMGVAAGTGVQTGPILNASNG